MFQTFLFYAFTFMAVSALGIFALDRKWGNAALDFKGL
jgi:hypothetical protein